jgi:cellulose synthase/poly-beta-1,6-N-acetylglucosamine synthase-like glycosyltransferase
MAVLFWVSVLFVLYTYFGYPLLIAVFAKFKPRTESHLGIIPEVTFLIAAYNEEAIISQKIENTLALDYPKDKLQIIVAADGSSDQTPEIVEKFSALGVELSYVPSRNGKMAAITRAMPLARGSIVVFSDANNMYDPQAVRILVAPFSDKTVGATNGAKLIVKDDRNISSAEGLYWKYESFIKKNETRFGTCTSSVGEIMAIRKELFKPPDKVIINDDRYMVFDLIRRGYRVVYTPGARSYEYVSKTARDEIERRARINAGAYQTIAMSKELLPFNRPLALWQIISHKYFRAFVPFAMIGALLANVILVLRPGGRSFHPILELSGPYNWIFLALQLLFYALALVGSLHSFTGKLGKILYIPVFLVNSNFASLAGLYSFLTNKKPHLWKRVDR